MLLVQVSLVAGVPACSQKQVEAGLQLAAAAAEAWERASLMRQGSGTGTCLRSNFMLLADTVAEQDAHLIPQEDHDMLASFKVHPQHLLTCCRGTYFPSVEAHSVHL